MWLRSSLLGAAPLAALVLGAACAPTEEGSAAEEGVSLYALTQASPGVYLYPPLAPAPAPTGIFDDSHLEGLQIALEATDSFGDTMSIAVFDAWSEPALKLKAAQELYFINVPAIDYFTDPSLSYSFRFFDDGNEIAFSDVTPHVFTVLGYRPDLLMGVKLRIERPVPAPNMLTEFAVFPGTARMPAIWNLGTAPATIDQLTIRATGGGPPWVRHLGSRNACQSAIWASGCVIGTEGPYSNGVQSASIVLRPGEGLCLLSSFGPGFGGDFITAHVVELGASFTASVP